MIILRAHKLIYVQEPRTGTRSTHNWLVNQLGGLYPWNQKACLDKEGASWHPKRHVGPRAFARMLKHRELPHSVDFLRNTLGQYKYFMATRNPYDVVVTFFVDNKHKNVGEPRNQRQVIAHESKDLLEYLQRITVETPGHVCDDENMARIRGIHHFFRYEDGYPNVLFQFLRGQGVPVTDKQIAAFPSMGKTPTKRLDWRSYYCEESKRMVGQLYARYLKRFGYSFEG